jgi:hypothetical protein
MRMRAATLLLALVLGAGTAGLLGCGKENPHLLSPARADRVDRALDEVKAAVDQHNCQGAQNALHRLDEQLSTLPDDTDPQLRVQLQRGAVALTKQAAKECQETETTPTVTETTPTTPTETETTPTTPTETTTTPTTTTPTTPTTTAPTTPTTPPPTTPGNGGATPTTP